MSSSPTTFVLNSTAAKSCFTTEMRWTSVQD